MRSSKVRFNDEVDKSPGSRPLKLARDRHGDSYIDLNLTTDKEASSNSETRVGCQRQFASFLSHQQQKRFGDTNIPAARQEQSSLLLNILISGHIVENLFSRPTFEDIKVPLSSYESLLLELDVTRAVRW